MWFQSKRWKNAGFCAALKKKLFCWRLTDGGLVFLFYRKMIYKWKNFYKLQVSLITVNYSKRSMWCSSFWSAAVRWDTTQFTAFSSISFVMADRFWRIASFSATSDVGLSKYTFDFKSPHWQKSRSVRSGDLGAHAWLKYRLIMQSSPSFERSRRWTGKTIWGYAPSYIKVTVWSACRPFSLVIILFCNSVEYRWPVTETVLKLDFETFSNKKCINYEISNETLPDCHFRLLHGYLNKCM